MNVYMMKYTITTLWSFGWFLKDIILHNLRRKKLSLRYTIRKHYRICWLGWHHWINDNQIGEFLTFSWQGFLWLTKRSSAIYLFIYLSFIFSWQMSGQCFVAWQIDAMYDLLKVHPFIHQILEYRPNKIKKTKRRLGKPWQFFYYTYVTLHNSMFIKINNLENLH